MVMTKTKAKSASFREATVSPATVLLKSWPQHEEWAPLAWRRALTHQISGLRPPAPYPPFPPFQQKEENVPRHCTSLLRVLCNRTSLAALKPTWS